jgi:hypothetical protein
MKPNSRIPIWDIPQNLLSYLKVGYLHPVVCTRSGSGFPSSVALDGNTEPDLLSYVKV